MVLRTNFTDNEQLPHGDWNQFASTINNHSATIATASSDTASTQAAISATQTTVNANQGAILSVQSKTNAQASALTTLQNAVTALRNRLTVLETAAPPPAVPNAPTGLTAGTITNTSVALSVTAPAAGATPTGYTFRYSVAGLGEWFTGPSGASTSGTVTGLTAGTAYDFQAFAYNAAGPGPVTATLTRSTTLPVTPSPAWTEMPPATSITMDNGGVVTLVGGVVQLNGVPMGLSSGVILVLKSDTGLIYYESNDGDFRDLPGGVGWYYWNVAQGTWVFSSDPRAGAPPSGVGFRNPNTIPFSSTSVWNIGMGNNATWASGGAAETTTLHSLVLNVTTNSYGQPIYFAKATDPLVTFQCSGQGVKANVPWTRQFHCPAGAMPSSGVDLHMNVYDETQPLTALSMFLCQCPDFGNLHTGSVVTSFLGGVLDLTLNGLVGSEYAQPWDYTGTDNFLGGVITQYDISQGVIRHALRCSISKEQMLSPNQVDGSSVNVEWPNTDVDYYHSTSVWLGNIPAGTYGIPNNVDVTALGLSTGGLMLAKCLQDYGMIWRDIGGVPPAISLYSVPELVGNARITEMNAAWNTIKSHVFRMTNQSPSNVNGGGTRRVTQLPPVGIGPAPQAVTASRIADLVELFGFNTYSSIVAGQNLWGSSPADYTPAHVIAQHGFLTNNSGFALRGREYHYAGRETMQATWLQQIVAATGMRFSMCVGSHGSADSQATMLSDVSTMQTLAATAANGIAWLEGNNEPNINSGSGTVSATNVRAVQAALWTTPAGPTIMGPSVVFGLPYPEGAITPAYISGADLTAINASMTLSSGHFYPPTLCDLDDGSGRAGAFDDVVTGLGLVYGKGVAISEFHPSLSASDTTKRPGGVNWNGTLDGYYTLIALLSAHRLGINGLWWYSLDDYASVLSGLFPVNEANPRPAAFMIRALCSVTRDTGATKRTFNPASISYTISNLPAPINANSPHTGGHHRAFRSSDGRGFVLVWNAQVAMGGTSVAVPLVFGQTYTTIREFNISLGTAAGLTAVQTVSNASTITIQLNASVRVIELVP